jgi:hypothetical protein
MTRAVLCLLCSSRKTAMENATIAQRPSLPSRGYPPSSLKTAWFLSAMNCPCWSMAIFSAGAMRSRKCPSPLQLTSVRASSKSCSHVVPTFIVPPMKKICSYAGSKWLYASRRNQTFLNRLRTGIAEAFDIKRRAFSYPAHPRTTILAQDIGPRFVLLVQAGDLVPDVDKRWSERESKLPSHQRREENREGRCAIQAALYTLQRFGSTDRWG